MSCVANRSEIVELALQYAGRGWRVLPTFNKEPPKGFRGGVHSASTDPGTIIPWFERWPRADIAIACGRPVVVDIDDPTSVPELVALRDTTLCASTPRGSVHLYFEGDGFRNQNFPWGEVRSQGYYVVAPPAPGRQWLNNLSLAKLPEWLAIAKTEPPCVSSNSPIAEWSEAIADHRKTVARWSFEETYALYACDHARTRVERALFGARQATLNRETFMLGQYAGAGAIERSRVAMMMELGMLANKSVDRAGRTFVQERGRLDIRKRILRALAGGMANPRLPIRGGTRWLGVSAEQTR